MKKDLVLGVAVLIKKDNKFLISKRLKGYGINHWAFPGGKIEHNESVQQACEREVLEETNLVVQCHKIDKNRLEIYSELVELDNKKRCVTIYVWADYISGELINLEPLKHTDWIWVDFNDVINMKNNNQLFWFDVEKLKYYENQIFT